jgi:hypothetical protein
MVNKLKIKQRALKALRNVRWPVMRAYARWQNQVVPGHLVVDLAQGADQTVVVEQFGTVLLPVHLRYGP